LWWALTAAAVAVLSGASSESVLQGRRGGGAFLSTTGSFTLSSGGGANNRAGNGELQDESDLGELDQTEDFDFQDEVASPTLDQAAISKMKLQEGPSSAWLYNNDTTGDLCVNVKNGPFCLSQAGPGEHAYKMKQVCLLNETSQLENFKGICTMIGPLGDPTLGNLEYPDHTKMTKLSVRPFVNIKKESNVIASYHQKNGNRFTGSATVAKITVCVSVYAFNEPTEGTDVEKKQNTMILDIGAVCVSGKRINIEKIQTPIGSDKGHWISVPDFRISTSKWRRQGDFRLFSAVQRLELVYAART